jgi:2-keto-4-pentenoate hydratase/2-oxohepta-3-ene-1,7-dioic acid hydratase in catechol pathway
MVTGAGRENFCFAPFPRATQKPSALDPMRLATILPHASVEPVVVATAPDGTWIELAGLVGRPVPRLEDGLPWLQAHLAHTAERAAGWTGPRYRESEFQFLPPVLRPPSFRDFYAFEQHVKTCRARRGLEMLPAWYEIPVFYFSNSSALIGHGGEVCAPAGSKELDFELELGVFIGRPGRDIAPERAWDHVAGFTVLNDFSARDLQRVEVTVGLGPAKAKDFATGLGPWLVTRDECADRIKGEHLTLEMVARVNGRELSRGNVASLYHSIPRLIAQASRDAELFPGDLIGTGTVGTGCILELGPESTGGWLKPGDVVELEIERLGTLRHQIVPRR